METTLFIILGILVLFQIYCFYQLARNEKVFKIRREWIIANDPKKEKYTYDYMFEPSYSNWLGLKFPSKSDFS